MTPAVYVLSAGRPGSVAPMLQHLGGIDHYWVIPERDDEEYEAAGVPAGRMVWDAGRGIAAARNLALTHAEHFAGAETSIQISDDLVTVSRLSTDTGKPRAVTYTLPGAIGDLCGALDEHGAWLAGCSPTANAFYAAERVHRKAFIVGDLIGIRTGSPRFDEELPLKEDYDYTLQHYTLFGRVARCDYLLPMFRHRTNPGGAVAYRTADLEQQAITRLKAKWPGYVRDNPRRPNEILLRFPR